MKNSEEKRYTTIRVTRAFHAKLRRLCDANKRTLLGQLEYLVEREMQPPTPLTEAKHE